VAGVRLCVRVGGRGGEGADNIDAHLSIQSENTKEGKAKRKSEEGAEE
jgi:hypothetical protein